MLPPVLTRRRASRSTDRPDLLPVLQARLRTGAGPVLARTDASLVLDAGADGAWTVLITRGELAAVAGAVRRPSTVVSAEFPVLRDVVLGARSGVEAFLAGDVRVRGNLALALQLDGIFEDDRADGRNPRFPRSRAVLAAGVRTTYLEAGPPDAPPVVLVHGLGATNASMLPTLWDLARDHRVLAPDLPGHGATEAVRDVYDAAFLGRWLIGFLEATGSAPAVLVGNSLGGRTSLEAALRAPEMVRGFVGLAPAVAFRRFRQLVPVVRVLRPELARAPMRLNRRLATRQLRSMFAAPERLPATWYDAAIDETVRVFGIAANRVAFFACLRSIYLDEAFGDRGFWDRLPALAPPALFVWGDRDWLVPCGFARHVEQAVPAATSVVLEDCGHVPQFELPDRTHALVRDFLGRLDRRDIDLRSASSTVSTAAATASPPRARERSLA